MAEGAMVKSTTVDNPSASLESGDRLGAAECSLLHMEEEEVHVKRNPVVT